jgi:hypothetical protein
MPLMLATWRRVVQICVHQILVLRNTVDGVPRARNLEDLGELLLAEEGNLANRCHGLHLEGLNLALMMAGMHYLLIHFDIPIGPAMAESTYRLKLCGLVDRPLNPLHQHRLDKGLQGGEMQYYQRCLTIDDATH